jgi:hypothetical protein
MGFAVPLHQDFLIQLYGEILAIPLLCGLVISILRRFGAKRRVGDLVRKGSW